jgi:hypothetical protein
MKRLFMLLILVTFTATVFVGCDSGGDMSSPPATNAPAAPAK